MIKISIIIPVYNVEKYLQCCLDSLLIQTLPDFEVICVNDGSKDNSLGVLRDYERKDSRIVVVDKKNEGSGPTRNLALSMAKGQYIAFLDSDDYYAPNFCEKMYDFAIKNDLDVAICCVNSFKLKDGVFVHALPFFSSSKIPSKLKGCVFEGSQLVPYLAQIPSVAWNKIYKREFLLENKILFQVVLFGQDQLFYIHAMAKATRLAFLDEALYFYMRARVDSAVRTRRTKDIYAIEIFNEIEKIIQTLPNQKLYYPILFDKYFSKTISFLTKCEPSFKSFYFDAFMKLFQHVCEVYPTGWWHYFKPKENDSYYWAKFKIKFAKLRFKLFR